MPTVLFLGPAAVCALSWFGAGQVIPRRFLSGERLLDVLTRVGAGSVLLSLALFALGRVHLFERSILIALTAVLSVFGVAVVARQRVLRFGRPRERLTAALLVACVAALALDLVAATAPPTSADALKYHLALPKLWLQQGSISDSFWQWETFNPAGIELLFAQGLALGGGSTAATLHAVFAALCAAAVWGLARELGAGRSLAGAVAAFVFVAQGIVTWEATSAFIELGLTFYVVLAVWHGVRSARSEALVGASLLGLFAGAAAGTKYLGLVAAAIVLGLWGGVALARRRFAQIGIAAGVALAAGGGWYLKNLVVTGNPIYPFVFGGKWVTPSFEQVARSSAGDYGVGGGIARLPLLPLDLMAHGGAFDRGQYVGTAIFVLAALALVTQRTPPVLVLVAGAAIFLVAWWELGPQARFLLPALAVLAAVGGAGSVSWLAAGRRTRGPVGAVLLVAGIAWLVASVALTRQLVPVTVGAEGRTHFLQRLTGTYDTFRAARARSGDATIGLVDYPYPFNVPGRSISLGQPEFRPSLQRAAYLARLRTLGVETVLAGGVAVPAQLEPLRDCVTRLASYHARFVTSRSMARSEPFDMTLYSSRGCVVP